MGIFKEVSHIRLFSSTTGSFQNKIYTRQHGIVVRSMSLSHILLAPKMKETLLLSRYKEGTSHMRVLWLASGENQKVLPEARRNHKDKSNIYSNGGCWRLCVHLFTKKRQVTSRTNTIEKEKISFTCHFSNSFARNIQYAKLSYFGVMCPEPVHWY